MDEFQIKTIDDITVVKVELVIATLRDAQPLWDEFEKNLLFYRKKTIIDLSQCNYVDSTFIGMIVRIFNKLDENKNQLKLVCPQAESIDKFRYIGITKVIDCFFTLPEAVDSYPQVLPIRYINNYQDFGLN